MGADPIKELVVFCVFLVDKLLNFSKPLLHHLGTLPPDQEKLIDLDGRLTLATSYWYLGLDTGRQAGKP